MYIRCPKCGRRGHLPDRWVPEAQSLRCRRCRAMFQTPELAQRVTERGGGPSSFNPIDGLRRPDQPAALMTDGYFSGFDDSADSPLRPGPGDSNYEVTFTLQDNEGEGDPETDWDADTDEFEPEAPSSDEIPSLSAAAPPGLESWPCRFVESWGRSLIVAALLMVAVLVPTIGYLLYRTISPSPSLPFPTPTLIAGLACAAALLMMSVPLLVLAVSMTQFVRDIRRLYPRAERGDLVARR